jgi:hypothetical protein
MSSNYNPGRVAGCLYLLLGFSMFRPLYVAALIVRDNATVTAHNIAAHEFRSVFLPRLLGIGLLLNGFAYVFIAFTGFLLPQYADRVTRVVSPAFLGEGAIVLWLLIKGARPLPPGAALSTSANA